MGRWHRLSSLCVSIAFLIPIILLMVPRTASSEEQGAEPLIRVRKIRVDASKESGQIRSLLGVNRGPIAYPGREGEARVSLVEDFRRFGIDFIRTHDFYGPTDWHEIFPDWQADVEDPDSYDFASSDVRIRGIVENGFQCFYRLGTSWKGKNLRPINDPPGTLRNPSGEIVHESDREDARKWGKICANIVRHYTRGWDQGYEFPIQYWEIWNEPDLSEQFWTGTPEQFYVLYEEASRAIKSLDKDLKVGGPACTGRFARPYVEDFVKMCHARELPLDFFSWHSYGGRDEFNPYQYYEDARGIRKLLDEEGFVRAENILTEWNAGIQKRLFSDTPAGAAYYASTLACLLDAGVNRAFQYCGDLHPGLGLFERESGEPKICAYSFLLWKRLLETPIRCFADGGDDEGYAIVAGKKREGNLVQILISDYQSSAEGFDILIENLPWGENDSFTIQRWMLDKEHRGDRVEELSGRGKTCSLKRRFHSGSVCLLELARR